jgi:hypothetical protein
MQNVKKTIGGNKIFKNTTVVVVKGPIGDPPGSAAKGKK